MKGMWLTFLVSVTKYLTRSNLWVEGFSLAYNIRRDLGFYGGHGGSHVRGLVTLLPQLGSKELTENRAQLSKSELRPPPSVPVTHALQQTPTP